MATAVKEKPAKAGDFPICLCGCKSKTAGGRFLPGHDARLKGQLQKAYRGDGLNAEQKKLVTSLGWDRFMKKGEEAPGKAAEVQSNHGLTVPQVNILRALHKAGENGMTRSELAVATGITSGMSGNLGPVFKEDIAKTEAKTGRKTLLGMRHVVCVDGERNGKDVAIYRISANGKKLLEKIGK